MKPNPTPAQRARVLDHLEQLGQDVTIARVCRSLGLSRRIVERSIEELRLAGEPLISSQAGIRYTRDPAEIAACVEALRRRAATQFVTARRLKDTGDRIAAGLVVQQPLWGQ